MRHVRYPPPPAGGRFEGAKPVKRRVPGEQSVERLRRLVDVGHRAQLRARARGAAPKRLVETAVELTGARYGALGVIDRLGTGLEQFITVGVDAETQAAIGDLPRGRGVLGVLIHDRKPLRLRDLAHDPRSVGFPPGHPPMESFLGVPDHVCGGGRTATST